jgi:hypothetical protein
MMRYNGLRFLLVLLCLGVFPMAGDEGFVPYLGQTPPGEVPVLFAPGIVNTGLYTRDFTLSPDGREFYFVVQIGQYKMSYIAGCRFVKGQWTRPEVVKGLDRPGIHYIEPHISPDGKQFFFASNLPGPGKTFAPRDEDIWVMDRLGDGWGEPRNLGAPINTTGGEFFPTTTRDGTLYYTGPEADGKGECIYRSRRIEGGYAAPERLPEQINAGKARYNAFFSPDDSLAIIPVYGHASNPTGVDYYVSFHRADDSWTEPVGLGPLINTEANEEHSACLSPDGRYLFFMSPRMPPPETIPVGITYDYLLRFRQEVPNGRSAIYWVDAAFIEKLRPEGTR